MPIKNVMCNELCVMSNGSSHHPSPITHHQKGFTLIEIMIAITIIALIFGVIISSASQVQKSGRDAQRQSDLRSVQQALQQYYADQQFYPTIGFNLANATQLTSCIGNVSPCPYTGSAIKTYLTTVPKDPNTNINYVYQPRTISGAVCTDNSGADKCYKYCLFTKLEGSSVLPAGYPCNDANTPAGGYNFALTQP
jgi:prepilin-type N-terminal cleavage/methylation domain-containing protein